MQFQRIFIKKIFTSGPYKLFITPLNTPDIEQANAQRHWKIPIAAPLILEGTASMAHA